MRAKEGKGLTIQRRNNTNEGKKNKKKEKEKERRVWKRSPGIEPDVGVEPTTLRLRVSRSTD